MLNIIQDNTELLEIFDEQSQIWWNSKGLLRIIRRIVKENYDENSNIYNISIQFKMGLQSLIDQPKKLLELINECLKPKQIEKKKFGEVFTPMNLVNDMLDKLPEEVWINENCKWFDPAVGMGNFPIAVYLRLMETLKKKIPNEMKRKKHIIENMLYMSELNRKNCFIVEQIFNVGKKYKMNLYNGDTLKMDIKKVFGVDKFDIIMGNPPYQMIVGKKKTEPLWNRFVIELVNYINNNGYLVFVHPSGWRNIDGKFKNVQQVIFSRNLKYLEIHNEKDGIKMFHAETRYDWYILKNEQIEMTKTKIVFQNGDSVRCNVKILEFIPNDNFKLIQKMLSNDNNKLMVLYNRTSYGTDKKWMAKEMTDEFNIPCVYTIRSTDEPTLFYSSKTNGNGLGQPKLIWSNGRITSVGSYIDKKGKFGLTQFAYAIIDDPKKLCKIKEVFDSDKFRKLMESCAVGQLTINYKVLGMFRKDFYKYFNDE